MPKVIHSVHFRGDSYGCGWYRELFPSMLLQTLLNADVQFRITDTLSIISDPNFYRMVDGGIRMVRLQRWYGKEKAAFMKNFLKPLADQLGMWLVYEIDDLLIYDEIPLYNIAKPHYSYERVGDSVKEIMEMCDLITVSTEFLGDVYQKAFKIPKEKFIIVPNYLPRWWIGEAMNIDRQMNLWRNTRNQPRIAFCCSTNHFDVQNKNNGVDDFTHLIPWIKANINKYKFIFVGGFPQQLKEEIQQKKVEFQPPSDLLNYPREIQLRNIDLLVAPLIDNTFNKCKSNIKFLEFSALGIPMAGQNILTYNKYTDVVFNDANQLDNIVHQLFFSTNAEKVYKDLILHNRNVIENGDKHSPKGYWLENNSSLYYNLYSMNPKTIHLSL